jgi:hypothetical protein
VCGVRSSRVGIDTDFVGAVYVSDAVPVAYADLNVRREIICPYYSIDYLKTPHGSVICQLQRIGRRCIIAVLRRVEAATFDARRA